jgi:methylated-DNA-protein-cysteine methyltransferase-like protein
MITPLSAKNEDFFERVYAVVRLIPPGRITSYGAIAAYLGAKKSSRMVGWAMNAAHKFNDIPAHRVVNRNGMLTGKMHFKTATEMQSLLESEHTSVVNDRIAEFKSKFWDPMVELTID